MCLRKHGLHRIDYIEIVGFLRGGRDIGGRGWLLVEWIYTVDTVEEAALMALIVKNNMDSVNALKQLNKNVEARNKDLKKLASGEKIAGAAA